jgi:hypothetical protein
LTDPPSPYIMMAAQTLSDVQITVQDVVASGFVQPLQVTRAGDGSNRLLVVEQPGRIFVIQYGRVRSKGG